MRPGLAVAVLLVVAAPARGDDPAAGGKAAYDRKDWAACARLYTAAACCAALSGSRDEAFLALGRHDYAVPPTSWDGLSPRFGDLTVAVFERSGHTPQVEEAAAFDERALAWLASR